MEYEPVESYNKDDEHPDVKGNNLRVTDPFMEVEVAFSCTGHGVSKFAMAQFAIESLLEDERDIKTVEPNWSRVKFPRRCKTRPSCALAPSLMKGRVSGYLGTVTTSWRHQHESRQNAPARHLGPITRLEFAIVCGEA